ncbi:MAG TPA: MAPEG family protein [Frateuria sp.]|uniref:MAPEG family protein n=1 Tax=Frateuria sp. TaxID=2211372 RepID=UPI002DEFCAD3|nr:MAPEG family protein [Frateuria sp.]
MAIELKMLVWSVILGLVQIGIAAIASVGQRSLGWAASARDQEGAPLTGVAGRLDRARGNFLETFAFFAALVLAVVAMGRQDASSALGAQLYFWARLVYVPVYAAGIPYLRTLVWAVSIVGIVLLLKAAL